MFVLCTNTGRNSLLYPMKRSKEDIETDSPCIGTCTLDEDDICIGCHRHIDEIIEAGS